MGVATRISAFLITYPSDIGLSVICSMSADGEVSEAADSDRSTDLVPFVLFNSAFGCTCLARPPISQLLYVDFGAATLVNS